VVDLSGNIAATFVDLEGREIRAGTRRDDDLQIVGPGDNPSSGGRRYLAFESNSDFDGSRNPDGSGEIFLWWQRRTRDSQRRREYRLIAQITAGDNCYSAIPKLSKLARFIAYVSNCNPTGENADGNQEIFIYDRRLEETLQVTHTEGCHNGPYPSSRFQGGLSIDTVKGKNLAFHSTCSLDAERPAPSDGLSVYRYSWSRTRNGPSGRFYRLADCPGCEASYNPQISKDGSAIVYWSGTGSSFLGFATDEVYLRWDTWHDVSGLCKPALKNDELAATFSPAADRYGRRILFPGNFNETGENPDGTREMFLVTIHRAHTGATFKLTDGISPLGAQFGPRGRYAVFGASPDGTDTTLFRIRVASRR
jgi:hypothetical protein